jgi:pilus assembly protein CpaB
MAKKPGAGGIILAAVALGLVAAYMIWNLERKREAQNKEHWTPVVVAREDIPARTKITSDMVTLMPYPKDLITAGSARDRKEVEGHITLARLKAKEQIRASDLLAEGQAPSIAYDIPPGMRAIAIGADEVKAVGSTVKPGDRVDVLATYSEPNTHQETTQMILQNCLILAVNQGETDTQNTKIGAKSSMTLAVKPEEAELLMAADRAGALRVMLRSPQDKSVISTSGVTTRDFDGKKTFEFATKPPDDQKATPVIISSQSRGHGSEIMIYRGSTGQAESSQ